MIHPPEASAPHKEEVIPPPAYDSFFMQDFSQQHDYFPTAPAQHQLDDTNNALPEKPAQTIPTQPPAPRAQSKPSISLTNAKQLLLPFLSAKFRQLDNIQLAILIITFPLTIFITVYRVIAYAGRHSRRKDARKAENSCRIDTLYSALKKRAFNQYFETQFEYDQLMYRRDLEQWDADVAASIKSASSWKFWQSASISASKTAVPPKPTPPAYEDVVLYKFSTDELKTLECLPYQVPYHIEAAKVRAEIKDGNNNNNNNNDKVKDFLQSPVRFTIVLIAIATVLWVLFNFPKFTLFLIFLVFGACVVFLWQILQLAECIKSIAALQGSRLQWKKKK